MKNYLVIILLLLIPHLSDAQNVKGYIYDASNEEPLTGVNIYYKDKGTTKGSISDMDGRYELDIPAGSLTLTFSYLGYETESRPLIVKRGQDITLNIPMKLQSNLMDEVVVSVGRYEQKISEVIVSMDVLKAPEIARQNPTDLSAVLNTMPGVDVTDKQPSIRGGSGWTYGVGSRSQVLVDGMSILTPAVGEINWNMIPMENIEQVEVIKGASSVLYGSSALNGLINVRTARPGLDPKTRANAYIGIYANPKNEGYKWWGDDFWSDGKYEVEPFLRRNVLSGIRNPIYNGLDISHSRRINNFDVSGSLNLFTDEGYREGNYNKRLRLGGNITYHDPNVHGLNYGLNGNFLSNDYASFFIWRSAKEAYTQSPLASMGRQGNSFYIDPFVNYSNMNNNTTHRLKGRIYHKADNIKSRRTDKSIVQIADKMGFNYDAIPDLVDMIQNPTTTLLPKFIPHLGDIMNGYFGGAAKEVEKLGNYYFPKAEPADYVDLISWIMGNTPLPSFSDNSELIPWALNAVTGNGKDNSSPADNTTSYFLDYQFSKKYDNAQLTTGATFEHIYNDSPVSGLHKSDNIGLFAQYDRKFFDRLTASLGMRLEYYRVDEQYKEAETKVFGVEVPFKPILRGGLNYELAEHSFIRASVGQGYRYPSIMEKYVYRDIGGVAAYPNEQLKAEKGFNAELGIKQGYKIGNFMGYLDVAGFYNYYKDMIEFQFGLFNNNTFEYVTNLMDVVTMITNGQMPGIGTRFENISRARIYGVDASINGLWNISPSVKMTYNMGYVFLQPIDVDADKINAAEEANTDLLAMKSKSNTSKYLKYRQKHSVKGVFDLYWKRFSLGTNITWKSKTLAVDYFMVDERIKDHPDIMDYARGIIFSGLHDYWTDKNKGYFAMDLRLGFELSKNIYLQASVNNVFNKEYSLRPMDVSAPRTFVLRMNTTF
ncbi:outer membrane receptor protein involved in Fe transport [Parabacteroides sp. PF5-5]|uniref:TonB-dependent receptor n=1 Tax=unclassified Parabacteroides TaxID=2649774 RepID=UPI002473BB5A|nr:MULTISPECIES: TonB-dependent receptor [unclassified Parabacteroides]MDH6305266.1 outer membrane receptor protein involved in Fe transport [Parabacteroides sp. PH5-39]MDH6316619.1 outer membrane receptor protein involved in Fe transport [Parabacteroides sp. PF5-13]MDH6320201.1 outer membrane receptor protein involved in Fe transport [Parabacteroides sp. PH5-13]MDH6323856.1 outer membrane receptor protein involved in Fe transport [Parabacteroides sp. PH5-8]MDH6327878.1 outer membrane receptor